MPKSPLWAVGDEIQARRKRGDTWEKLAGWCADEIGVPVSVRMVSAFWVRMEEERAKKAKAAKPPRERRLTGQNPPTRSDPKPVTAASAVPETGRNLQKAIDLLLDGMADPGIEAEIKAELADRVLELDVELENRRLSADLKSKKAK